MKIWFSDRPSVDHKCYFKEKNPHLGQDSNQNFVRVSIAPARRAGDLGSNLGSGENFFILNFAFKSKYMTSNYLSQNKRNVALFEL